MGDADCPGIYSGERRPALRIRCGVCRGEGLLFPLQYTGREEDELYNEPCPYCEGSGIISVPTIGVSVLGASEDAPPDYE